MKWAWRRAGSQAVKGSMRMPRLTRLVRVRTSQRVALDDDGADLARAAGVEGVAPFPARARG